MKNPILYRISQFVGFLLGARVFVALLLTFALYVSTFFLFNQEESLRNFVFDFKVHGIIFCTVLSIFAGGIINQFYDREKDQLTKPFRTKFQSFLKQKYFLYAYIALNLISLGIAFLISPRVLFFFLIYQFFMWFYSHKLSKIVILNNVTFVSLTLYPFFGMMVYYHTFSGKVFLMAVFLFLILLIIDVTKDFLTKNADKMFGYTTIPNYFGNSVAKIIIVSFLVILMLVSMLLINKTGIHSIINLYFAIGLFVIIFSIYLMLNAVKKTHFFLMNILRIWVFIGIISMLLDGIIKRF
ncbi:UbiA family prenyltransferase [Kaistella montana]|uniref:UbiA family prenyltransferase n=1 Tax=Kaistella montana TaxID=1849733 RepID=A0ABW5K7D2_9FLAO|nr:UbiA family prenyltransferase [Kaistella montana]MCQ4034659.1 UbiA family prenyltransferase [Kaistella montana]